MESRDADVCTAMSINEHVFVCLYVLLYVFAYVYVFYVHVHVMCKCDVFLLACVYV